MNNFGGVGCCWEVSGGAVLGVMLSPRARAAVTEGLGVLKAPPRDILSPKDQGQSGLRSSTELRVLAQPHNFLCRITKPGLCSWRSCLSFPTRETRGDALGMSLGALSRYRELGSCSLCAVSVCLLTFSCIPRGWKNQDLLFPWREKAGITQPGLHLLGWLQSSVVRLAVPGHPWGNWGVYP